MVAIRSKAVSELVSTLLIVAITVAAALATYIVVTGGLRVTVSQGVNRPEIGIDAVGYRGVVVVYVRNRGPGDAVITTAYLEDVRGRVLATFNNSPVRIPAGRVGRIVLCPDKLSPGTYRVKVVERSGVEAGRSIEIAGTTISTYRGPLANNYTWRSPITPMVGYHAEYYNTSGEASEVPDLDRLLSGGYSLIVERHDLSVDFTDNPSYGGAYWRLPQRDRFAAVWRAVFFAPVTGVYEVSAYADDGVVVIVDGVRVVDAWRLQSPTYYSVRVRLDEGPHNVTIAYFENYGTARLRVLITPEASQVAGGVINATYYDLSGETTWPPPLDEVLAGTYPKITSRYEALEDLNYSDHPGYPGEQWPFADERPTEEFAAVWNGSFTVEGGLYRLVVENDDGVVVWVDGEEVLEDWTHHSPKTRAVDLHLLPGTHNITIAYFEHHGIARLMVRVEELGVRVTPSGITASFYNLKGWSDWSQEGVNAIRDSLLQGQLPLIGNYTVEEVSFSDHPDKYPYGQWPIASSPTQNVNHFAALFKATVTVNEDCTLLISVHSDDGVTVWVDGVRALDDWSLHPPTWSLSAIPLTSGEHELQIAYFECSGNAVLHLELAAGTYTTRVSPVGGDQIEIEFSKHTLNAMPERFIVTVMDKHGDVLYEAEVDREAVRRAGLRILLEVPGLTPFMEGIIAVWTP